MSFPSGHASSTATLAASISEMYDWDLKLAVPLYVTTVLVSASRIQADQHHLSDVVAGMTLGTLVGTSFAKSRKEKNAAGAAGGFAVAPYFDGHYKGLVCQWTF
jgi:membrane-associated phospholipid phosphatase